MVFCKKRYRKLLRYSQQLEEAGKNLSDMSDFDYRELLRYSAGTYAQLEWESRDSYIELMDHFLNGKISDVKLKIEFLEIQESYEQVQQVLESNLIIKFKFRLYCGFNRWIMLGFRRSFSRFYYFFRIT